MPKRLLATAFASMAVAGAFAQPAAPPAPEVDLSKFPAASVEDMYRPDYRARSDVGTVVIAPK